MMTPSTNAVQVLDAEPRELDKLPTDTFDELLRIVAWLPEFQAARKLRPVAQRACADIGLPFKTVYRRVGDFLKTGDWRCLVDRRRCPFLWDSMAGVGLPQAFVDFYLELKENHKRADKSAHSELLLIWRTKSNRRGRYYDKIPGYAEWPEADPRTGIPHGWSYKNLQRVAPENPYDKKATKEGLFAASFFRPPVLTTRVGMKLGERVEFDDHDFDAKTHFPGQPKAMRPTCFGGVDGLSGFLDLVVRPTFWDAQKAKKEESKEFQFRCFVIHWLTVHGYRNDEVGTLLCGENAKAVFRENFATRLSEMSGGKIRTHAGPMFGESVHQGQFGPQAKGNFRNKAMIEEAWSVIENLLDSLPGQMGSHQRLNGPAELHGREDYLQRVLKKSATLPADRAKKLILPVMTFHQFSSEAITRIAEWLDNRDHELEGWDKLEFEKCIWRPDERSLAWYDEEDFARLPEDEQRVLGLRLKDPNLDLTRAVKLSRREVWTKLRTELVRFSPKQYHRLFPREDGFEVTVQKNHLIEFRDREKFGPGEFRFLARDRHHGDAMPGEKFLVFFNPLQPRWLNVCRADGSNYAMFEAWDRAAKNDVDAINRSKGKQAAWETPRRHAIANRHHQDAEERNHMLEHNRAVVEGRETEELAKVDTVKRTQERAARRKQKPTNTDLTTDDAWS